jgi:hypothetical protein
MLAVGAQYFPGIAGPAVARLTGSDGLSLVIDPIGWNGLRSGSQGI